MIVLKYPHETYPAGTPVEPIELYPPAPHAGRPRWHRRVRLPDGQVITLPDMWFEPAQKGENAE